MLRSMRNLELSRMWIEERHNDMITKTRQGV